MSDRNYLSITGDAAGNVFVQGELVLSADQPREERRLTYGEIRPTDAGFADALKFSGVRDLDVVVWRLIGGVEDCLDVNNRCRGLRIHVVELHPRGRYVATIKGESHDIKLTGTLHGHGRETDIDLGGHSDQARGRTTGVQLGLDTVDGSPVHVRLLHCWDPELLNANLQPYAVDDRLQGIFAHVWRLLKKFLKV